MNFRRLDTSREKERNRIIIGILGKKERSARIEETIKSDQKGRVKESLREREGETG